MVPESALPGRPLGQKLPHFFRLAWRLVSEGQPGTRQQVITKVASEGGLHRVKELTDTRFENISDGQQIAVLKEAMIPFFQAISHEDVLSSLLLETAVDTIYNFLFGPSGRRAIRLFTYVAPILRAIKSSSESNVVFAYVEASLAVLQKIVDLNGTALILAEFHPLLQTMSDCLGEDITLADNLSMHRSRQCLSKIQRRLDLGSAMSPAQMVSKNITDPLVTFEIHQDMPGSLSMEGPRHDNDHKDIIDIQIMPTTQEVQSHRLEYLPFRDPGAWHLPGIKGLLDRQFRLLREDTVGQLRDAVGLEVERLRNAGRSQEATKNSKQGPRTIAYKDSDLIDIEFDKWKGLYRGGLDTLGKEHFTSLYKPARERALSKRNILAGWAVTGLFPFDPERVLRHTPKPPTEISVSKANEMVSFPQGQILQSPITPVTPVTIEALTSLHNLIKQEACALNEPDKQRIQKHVQKLASAAQVSYAKQILLQDQNRFLTKINNEARARRSARSMVLGKAKVLSYEDLEEARAERAAKEKATVRKGRGKRGRRRKSSALQEDSSVPTDDLVLESTETPVP